MLIRPWTAPLKVVSFTQPHQCYGQQRESLMRSSAFLLRWETIQSNLFRVREMFQTVNYTGFERLFEGPLAQDECVNSAYANALAKENLSHCPNAGRGANITNI